MLLRESFNSIRKRRAGMRSTCTQESTVPPAQTIHYYGYLEISVDRDLTDIRILGTQPPLLRTLLEDSRGGRVDFRNVQMMARRKELSGPGDQQKIDLALRHSATAAPGRWEFALRPPAAFYASGFLTTTAKRPWAARMDGTETLLLVSTAGLNSVKFVLAASPGAVHGAVMLAFAVIVAGVPVFLEPFGYRAAAAVQRSLRDDADRYARRCCASIRSGLAAGAIFPPAGDVRVSIAGRR